MKTSTVLKKFSTVVTGSAAFLALSTFSAIVAPASQAVTITNGFTYSVASSGDQTVGTHYHSNTGGAFGNPAGKAEVGDFFSEEVRGLSEYNMAGLGTATSAFVTFDVFKAGGLFSGQNDFPFTGNINIVAYQGNNLEDISDYQAPSIGTVGTFNTAGLSVGNTLSFDITSIFNNAIANGWSSLGMRLQIASGTDPQGGAWTFNTFRLTTDNQSNNQTVPEPASVLGLLAIGALGAGAAWKRKLK